VFKCDSISVKEAGIIRGRAAGSKPRHRVPATAIIRARIVRVEFPTPME